MGYQAILFCPDEKLARIVSQVFSELDFAVEPVNEPFAAVKKLMAQRYDAIVVDCDNEQNTSLLFKSARNSSFNQNALAIALVEGQTGVAKAYRIGANLVLTKPINVEQAKGTLRVARGLLRKSIDATNAASPVSSAMPGKPASSAPARTPAPVARKVEPPPTSPPPANHPTAPEFESPLPVTAASAKVEEKPSPVILPAPTQPSPMVAQTPIEPPTVGVHQSEAFSREVTKIEPLKPVSAASPAMNAPTPQGAAAAPAPAKETSAAPAKSTAKTLETTADEPFEETKHKPVAQSKSSLSVGMGGTASYSDGPSFAALGVDEGEESGGRKKIFMVVAIVLALIVATYFGWSKFGSSHNAAPAQQPAAPAPQPQDAAPADVRPMSAPQQPDSEVETPNRASVTAPAPSSKKSPAKIEDSSNATRIELSSVPEATKPAVAPLVVKSAATKGVKSAADDSSAAAPSPLAVGTSGDGNLGGIMSSSPSVSQPVLARVNVSQGVSQGLVIKRVQPKYPPSALAAHREGAVQIEATVDKQGNVVDPKVLSGDPMLAAAAVQAVRQWRYKPYYLDGQPVEIQTQITVNFKASN
jgi:periplasmic protein TonB